MPSLEDRKEHLYRPPFSEPIKKRSLSSCENDTHVPGKGKLHWCDCIPKYVYVTIFGKTDRKARNHFVLPPFMLSE